MEAIPAYIIYIFLVLIFSAFIKFATVFSIFKLGLGLKGICIEIVFLLLAISCSMFVLSTQLDPFGGFESIVLKKDSQQELESIFSPYLKENSNPDLVQKFTVLSQKLSEKNRRMIPEKDREELSKTELKTASSNKEFFINLAAYTISEVQRAFEIGLLVLIPFLLIDLIVANILMLLGMTNIKQGVIAFPLKVLLFFSVNGWGMLTNKIVTDYL